MTFTDKKIEDFIDKFCEVESIDDNGKNNYQIKADIADFGVDKIENWLRKTIAEVETSGLNKAISYLNETQQKYKDDTKSLLCDYTLRKMIKDLKELPALSADREQE